MSESDVKVSLLPQLELKFTAFTAICAGTRDVLQEAVSQISCPFFDVAERAREDYLSVFPEERNR